MSKKLTSWILPAVSLALPLLARAGTITPADPSAAVPQTTKGAIPTIATSGAGALNIICVVINWVFYLLIILAVVFVILAAIKYVTAAGDAEKIQSANHQIIYAAVAVVVGLIARGFPFIISNVFGVAATDIGGC